MATAEFSRGVPSELSERFRKEESPSFEVVRQAGNVRLWRTMTLSKVVQGATRPGKVHYHVTVGDQADMLLMGSFERALANFEAMAAQQAAGMQ